jgi:hypothetical protein
LEDCTAEIRLLVAPFGKFNAVTVSETVDELRPNISAYHRQYARVGAFSVVHGFSSFLDGAAFDCQLSAFDPQFF